MSISIHIEGAIQAARDYHERAQRAKDVRPAMDRVVDVWLASEERQFQSEDGWPDIKPKSRDWKTKRGLDPRTMRATGLLHSVLTQRGMEGAGQQVDVQTEGLTVGIRPGRSDVYYAQTHVKKWPLISFDDQASSEANEVLGRWLETGSTS